MKTILNSVLILFFIFPNLAFGQPKTAQEVLVDEVSFEEESGNIKIILTLNKPDKVFCYDIKDPSQIIIDLLGNAYAKVKEQIPINKGGIKRLLASREIGKTNLAFDKNYYPVDFFIVELDKPKEYQLTSGNTKAVVEIGVLKAKKEEALSEEGVQLAQEKPKQIMEEETKAVSEKEAFQPPSKVLAKEKSITEEELYRPKEETKAIPKEKKVSKEEPRVLAKEKRIEEAQKLITPKEEQKEKSEDIQTAEVTKVFKQKEEIRLTPNRKKSIEARNKGYAAQTQGKFDQAQECYQQAIKLDPKYPTPHNDLGIIYEERGLLEKAAEEYKKAIELDPNYAAGYSNLALLYEKQAKLSEALPYWKKRADLGNPDDPWTKRAKDKLERYNK
ncbi:MAG: tetratricopeptide repeat protein [Candidatus Omnitrophica bacterium]|nr:tetratricopeptide repeat protein [Candidatus Omnitrophota bacterium]